MNRVEKYLGKIAAITIGLGGYQGVQFGISFSLEGQGQGVGDFWGAWGPEIKCTEHCKWTEADRRKQVADAFIRLAELMVKAKVMDAAKLKGIPVEVTIEGNALHSWRILEEVL